MNPNNYCTLEASQRLVAAGISLETDYLWCETNRGWRLHPKSKAGMYRWKATIPAPTMAEVWRELPDSVQLFKDPIIKQTVARLFNSSTFAGTNTTDALIELLIWVRREAKS